MINVIIIDDERLARKELTTLLSKIPEINIIAECANADDAKKEIKAKQPDLIFLDIQMPGKTGFELLEELDDVPYVIFVTAYDEYALKAFEVNALDYVLKPVEEIRLKEAVKKVKRELEEDKADREKAKKERGGVLGYKDQIFIKDGEKCWFVTLEDIRLFQSEGNYVQVFFNDHKPLILKSLNHLEERLDNKTFFRANRKHIVNLRWIRNIEPWFNGGLRIELKDGAKVEVSRRQAAKFKDIMSL